MSEREKCYLVKEPGKTKLCATLEQRLEADQFAPERGKGLWEILTFDVRNVNRGPRSNGVAYKTSRKDKGLMLNFCPWCGTALIKNGAPAFQDGPDVDEEARQ